MASDHAGLELKIEIAAALRAQGHEIIDFGTDNSDPADLPDHVYLKPADQCPKIDYAKPDGALHPVQEAFSACHGLQCGFCTPGMVMSAVNLLKDKPNASETEIREGLEGNICRCTGYHNIVKAIAAAWPLIHNKPMPTRFA